MVKRSNTKSAVGTIRERSSNPIRITASTQHGYIDEFFTPFGGCFAFVKMLAALQFEELFNEIFIKPERTPENGHYFMFQGTIFLFIIGFQRFFHFSYIAHDPMLLGIMGVIALPVVSTFWRWMKSCGINQANSLLKLIAAVRNRVWLQAKYRFESIRIDVDTTVETVYGDIEGARKGHNRQHRGKLGLRPVLAFINETKEYLAGKLRKGTTISGETAAKFIKSFKPLLPECVKRVLLRADSEFYSEQAVYACKEEGFDFTISVKGTKPEFDLDGWYRPLKRSEIEYNSCFHKPPSWKNKEKHRFVAMRIPKKDAKNLDGQQADLFDDGNYSYRVFITSRKRKAPKVIDEYDGRASAEPLIGEAKREGLAAIPSKLFQTNMAFFQIVMLVYNLWRHMQAFVAVEEKTEFHHHTIHVARLKALFLAAKITRRSRQVKINYSLHMDFKPKLEKLFKRFDDLQRHPEVWDRSISWGST